MNVKKGSANPGDGSHSDTAELFESAFREAIDKDASEIPAPREALPKGAPEDRSNAPVAHRAGDDPMEGENRGATEKNRTPPPVSGIQEREVRKIATGFWNYLKKDSRETFLDADIKDVNRAVLNFLNKDIVGKKIILLEDEKLRSANAVARFLKRKRSLRKSDTHKSVITRIKKINRYLNNPIWRDSFMVVETRQYLEKHMRKMTPSIIRQLNSSVKNLQSYFNGTSFDGKIFDTDLKLKQMAMNLGYRQFAVCQKSRQALAKNETGDVLCSDTQCNRGQCPFEACHAHGEEIDFLAGLRELFSKLEIIRPEGNLKEALT